MNKSLTSLGLILAATAIALAGAPSASALPSAQEIAATVKPDVHTPARLGDVIAIVPAASIGPIDSVVPQLEAGRTYSDRFLIWVARSALTATLQVKVSGAGALHCSSAHLHVGAVNVIGCGFKTSSGPSGTTSISITVESTVIHRSPILSSTTSSPDAMRGIQMSFSDDNRISGLLERCEFLSRSLLRAAREDPYGDEANALAAKLFDAKVALRQARIDDLDAATQDALAH
jgi:hypothetical protein